MNLPVLHVEGLTKVYPGTVALDGVSVGFEGGRINALVGKNGAGKSTLVKILAGAVKPTAGKLRINGREERLTSPADAFEKGIATVHQELSLVPGLTVAENILLGRLPHVKSFGGFAIDWPAAFERARAVVETMNVDLDVKSLVSDLGVARQQIVEIAKAMSFDPIALLLDEPTSALAQHETENLFTLIRKLVKRGVAVIYITHRLQELEHIADCVTVLRDGLHVGTIDMADADAKTLVHMMFGDIPRKERPVDLDRGTDKVLEARGLGRSGAFTDVCFSLYRGEVLGLAGMLGSGRTELLRAIFGAEPFDEGELLVEGEAVTRASPERMKRLGVAYTPENRKEEGLIQLLSIRANICLASMEGVATRGFITRAREEAVAGRLMDELQIRAAHMGDPVSHLSGGNQQKVVVGNWLATEPRIILFDEPTRGIDVQAKQQIFQVMWDLSRRGISSLFVSSELEELVEVCHRILILKKGRITDEVDAGALSADDLFVRCMEE